MPRHTPKPSPLVGEVDEPTQSARRVRGSCIKQITPHPARCSLHSDRPPSPSSSRMFPTWTAHQMAKPGNTYVLAEGLTRERRVDQPKVSLKPDRKVLRRLWRKETLAQ